jgi:hypothetical protein
MLYETGANPALFPLSASRLCFGVFVVGVRVKNLLFIEDWFALCRKTIPKYHKKINSGRSWRLVKKMFYEMTLID